MFIYPSIWPLGLYFLPDMNKLFLPYQHSRNFSEGKIPYWGKAETHCHSCSTFSPPNTCSATTPLIAHPAHRSPTQQLQALPEASDSGEVFQSPPGKIWSPYKHWCQTLTYTNKKQSIYVTACWAMPLKSQSTWGHFPFQWLCVWNSVIEFSTEREKLFKDKETVFLWTIGNRGVTDVQMRTAGKSWLCDTLPQTMLFL